MGTAARGRAARQRSGAPATPPLARNLAPRVLLPQPPIPARPPARTPEDAPVALRHVLPRLLAPVAVHPHVRALVLVCGGRRGGRCGGRGQGARPRAARGGIGSAGPEACCALTRRAAGHGVSPPPSTMCHPLPPPAQPTHPRSRAASGRARGPPPSRARLRAGASQARGDASAVSRRSACHPGAHEGAGAAPAPWRGRRSRHSRAPAPAPAPAQASTRPAPARRPHPRRRAGGAAGRPRSPPPPSSARGGRCRRGSRAQTAGWPLPQRG